MPSAQTPPLTYSRKGKRKRLDVGKEGNPWVPCQPEQRAPVRAATRQGGVKPVTILRLASPFGEVAFLAASTAHRRPGSPTSWPTPSAEQQTETKANRLLSDLPQLRS